MGEVQWKGHVDKSSFEICGLILVCDQLAQLYVFSKKFSYSSTDMEEIAGWCKPELGLIRRTLESERGKGGRSDPNQLGTPSWDR